MCFYQAVKFKNGGVVIYYVLAMQMAYDTFSKSRFLLASSNKQRVQMSSQISFWLFGENEWVISEEEFIRCVSRNHRQHVTGVVGHLIKTSASQGFDVQLLRSLKSAFL